MSMQHYYAWVLDRLAKVGFVFLTLCFAVYLAGPLKPLVAPEHLPRYWGLPAARYRAALGVEGGWSWFRELHHGDFLTYLPLAFLAVVTILAYLGVVVKFFRRREFLPGLVAFLQVAVLLLAASGLVVKGGH